MHIIVDAYNVIFSTIRYGTTTGRGLKAARYDLFRDMAEYRRARGHSITLVFDATKSGEEERTSGRQEGINVVFTRRGETADEVIIELVEKSAGAERVVVTSDTVVRRGAERRGAAVMDAETFVRRLEEVRDGIKPQEERDSRTLPKKQRSLKKV
jgi:predicted RNA-binding protein with PIN domain